jgi:hypothetical protein
MGMAGYISVTNLIKQTAAQDDPYADWAIVQLEEKLMQAKAGMLELTQQLDGSDRTCRHRSTWATTSTSIPLPCRCTSAASWVFWRFTC